MQRSLTRTPASLCHGRPSGGFGRRPAPGERRPTPRGAAPTRVARRCPEVAPRARGPRVNRERRRPFGQRRSRSRERGRAGARGGARAGPYAASPCTGCVDPARGRSPDRPALDRTRFLPPARPRSVADTSGPASTSLGSKPLARSRVRNVSEHRSSTRSVSPVSGSRHASTTGETGVRSDERVFPRASRTSCFPVLCRMSFLSRVTSGIRGDRPPGGPPRQPLKSPSSPWYFTLFEGLARTLRPGCARRRRSG
jgi:hypothetical protein